MTRWLRRSINEQMIFFVKGQMVTDFVFSVRKYSIPPFAKFSLQNDETFQNYWRINQYLTSETTFRRWANAEIIKL